MGAALARALGLVQRVVDRPARDSVLAGKRLYGRAASAGLDDLVAFVVGQFAMVAHVKFTFLFLANFLQAPRLPASAEAGQVLGVRFSGFAERAGARAAQSGKRVARSRVHLTRRKGRDAEGAAQGTRDAMRSPESAEHGTRCVMRLTQNVPLMPPVPLHAAGRR